MITCELCGKDIEEDIFSNHIQLCESMQKLGIAWKEFENELMKSLLRVCKDLTFIVNTFGTELKKVNETKESDSV